MIPPLFGKQEVGIWWVQKRFPRNGVPIWSLWPNIRSLPSIVAEKKVTKNVHICSMRIKINKVSKQEVGIWWVQKRFPRYGVPIWSLWPNIRCLPSIVAEKNVHIPVCSMCIKVGKQEVGIRRVQKCYPQYGIPIWRLWPNIRFLPSSVTEKNAMKNILDGRKDRGKTVYPPPPLGSGGIKILITRVNYMFLCKNNTELVLYENIDARILWFWFVLINQEMSHTIPLL
jgi:hypothetical protein